MNLIINSNRKIRAKRFILSILLSTFLLLCLNFNLYLAITDNHINDENRTDYHATIKSSTTSGTIHIDNNWTSAKIADICKGSGTFSDPYVIEDLTIDAGGLGSCILIENTIEYFRIENCTILNSGGSFLDQIGAIHLNNADNGTIVNNTCSFNGFSGISVHGCKNITITNNKIHEGIYTGIEIISDNTTLTENVIVKGVWRGLVLDYATDVILSGNKLINCSIEIEGHILSYFTSYRIDTSNTVNNKPVFYYKHQKNLVPDNFINAGQVLLVNCSESIISNLNISYASTALFLIYSDNNTVSNNNLLNNGRAIDIDRSKGNEIINNILRDNGVALIMSHGNYNNFSKNTIEFNYNGYLSQNSDNNIIHSNNITNNESHGIDLPVGNHNNTLFNNQFISNGIHAEVYEIDNKWDNGSIGNYWDNYTGKDKDDNGVGDTPHTIYKYGQDNFPIWWDPPELSIISPQQNERYIEIPPDYNITIEAGIVDTMWYTLNLGSTKYFIMGNGTMNSTVWNSLPDGEILIRFHANDSKGYIGYTDVIIIKGELPTTIPIGNTFIIFIIAGIFSLILIEKFKKRIKF